MADIKISELSAAAAALAAMELETNNAGTSEKVTLAQIDTLFSGTTQTLSNKTLASPVVTGTFTSVGIEDNATSEKLQIGDFETILNTAGTGSYNLQIRGAVDSQKDIRYYSGTTIRWQMGVDNATESATQTGANFDISRYTNAGAFIDTPFSIERLTGNIIVTGTIDGRDIAADGATLDDLPVSNLADGTDGELITWDATGAPATVAVGTAGHVLTSNGVGAAPTFQAAAGGFTSFTAAGDSGGGQAITDGNTLSILGGTSITTADSATDTVTINVDDDFLANTGDVGTGVYDFGGATSFEIPNSATPTVDADGEIAVDTTVTDFSHGVMKYFGGEEMGVVAMPIAQFTTPGDGELVAYNATNDEFELVAASGGGNVSNTGTPLDNQVAVWTSATVVEGTTGLTYDGTALGVTGNITVSGTVDGRDIAADGAVLDTALLDADFVAASGVMKKTGVGSYEASTVAVSDISTGTDGELITWDASGNPATVAVGTSGHVLTSNGAGAAPTFQAAAGGFTSFTAAGDSGTPQTISDGNTLTIAGGTGIDSVAGATDTVTLSIDSTVTTLTGTQTLTNKTINLTSNTLTGTTAQFNTALSDGTFVVQGGALGTPSSGVLTNCTGTASGLTAGTVTTNANLTGHITSTGNATVLGSFTVAQLSTALSDATISGNNTGDEAAASTTVAGVAELATSAEIDTGTDNTRVITPDGLQASKRNIRYMTFVLVASGTAVSADTSIGGDFTIPFSGTILQDDTLHDRLAATTDTAGTTGTMIVDIHKNGVTIMGANKLDIETGEKGTQTATTQPDLTVTTVAAGDILTFDVDAIHTTPAQGLKVMMAILED